MSNSLTLAQRARILDFDPLTSTQSVTEFCHCLGISTTSFYRLRERAASQGRVAALRPRSRAPKTTRTKYGRYHDGLILEAHQRLTALGAEAGPWSVWWQLYRQGITPLPSRSTVARRLRSLGLSAPSPKKRPHASTTRFARHKANELWQLDGIDIPLQGRLATIYQIIDDATRYLVALTACWGGENSRDAIATLTAAMTTHGQPQVVLTDNSKAFNTHRRGFYSATETFLASRGVRPISGRVAHPQTQGKVERAHQGVHRWLQVRQIITLDDLNNALAAFTQFYNHERQHLGIGAGMTPQMAWERIEHATPYTDPIDLDLLDPSAPLVLPTLEGEPLVTERLTDLNGAFYFQGRRILLHKWWRKTRVHLLQREAVLEIYDQQGTFIAEIGLPLTATGRTYARPAHVRLPNQ